MVWIERAEVPASQLKDLHQPVALQAGLVEGVRAAPALHLQAAVHHPGAPAKLGLIREQKSAAIVFEINNGQRLRRYEQRVDLQPVVHQASRHAEKTGTDSLLVEIGFYRFGEIPKELVLVGLIGLSVLHHYTIVEHKGTPVLAPDSCRPK